MESRRKDGERGPAARSCEAELGRRRRTIRALDGRILALVARRLEEADAIARLKTRLRIPLRNYEVEAQVAGRLADLAEDLGRPSGLGRDLAGFLIGHSLETQSAHLETVYEGDRLRTLVVGGKGGMGSWMARFLNGQGHRVQVEDPRPGACAFERVGPADAAAREADLVVVAVPMSACARVLEDLWGRRPEGVVAEMCSLKSHLVPTARRLRREGMRLVSFHPMFGPSAATLSGRTVAICSDGAKRDRDLVRGLFASTSASTVEMGAREHDRRMALVLGLVHLSNLALAQALARSGVSFAALQEVAGVTFTKQLATTREVVAENASLYYEIQDRCAKITDVRRLLAEALEAFGGDVAREDAAAFRRRMAGGARYLR